MTDLLTVLLDIDRLRGKVCGACKFWQAAVLPEHRCAKQMMPLDATDNCPHWKDKHADRNAKLTAAVVGSLCLLLSALPGPARAFDSQKWAQVDDATREKFRNLRNNYGTSCCDVADGHLVQDPDWMGPNADGSFDVNYDGAWHNVEKERIVQSPTGQALIWRNPSVDKPYCFAPGVQG